EFRRKSTETIYREGEGLNGQAWRTRDLVFVPDLGEMRGCPRSPTAQRVGLKSGVCVPITLNGPAAGTVDVFVEERLSPSEGRLDTFRSIGRLVSAALERVEQQAQIDRAKKELETKVNQLMKVARTAAGGDLTAEVEVRGDDDMGRLGEALGKMM